MTGPTDDERHEEAGQRVSTVTGERDESSEPDETAARGASLYRDVVAKVGVGVAVYDRTGAFVYVNDAYAAMLGQDVDTLVRTPIWEVNPAIEPERFEDYWDSFTPGSTRRREAVHQRADGSELHVETHTTAIEADGKTYHVGTITDISERVEGWAELEREHERLEQFASVVSHDLRNPLNVAIGRLQLVDQECNSDHIGAIERSLEEMEELIDNVVSLARDGSRLTEPERVALSDAATTAWSMVSTQDAGFELADSLGVVESTEQRLTELFKHLMRNALDHAGPDVTIRVGTTEQGFFVEDDGDGIDDDVIDNALEDGYTTAANATGFGLTIVEEIADAHEWTVQLTESSTGGARVEISGVEIE
jgi:PAS domain S-box-containing protein